MKKQQRAIRVGVLTRKISNSLADFGSLMVQGELSQLKHSANGHLYATLKDADASISVVMWRSTVQRQKNIPREGQEVVVRGSLSVYEPRGQYQLTATSIQEIGQGDLAAQFEALKQRLQQEGFFDPEHKTHLPFLPRAVGVATASGSAALADICEHIRERFPTMPIIHAPCQVQGRVAKHEIADAILKLDKHPLVDVIICGRGGGSLEDLWSFNEELVVHRVFNCRTPIVSAVGHETDTSLSDLAADVRAKTPTAAAAMVVPELDALYEQVDEYRESLYDNIRERLDAAALEWRGYARHRALAGPAFQLNMRRQRLDEYTERLQLLMQQQLHVQQQAFQRYKQALAMSSPQHVLQARRQHVQYAAQRMQHVIKQRVKDAQVRLMHVAAQMDALSPLKVLQRGYAVVQHDGRVLQKAEAVASGDLIHAQLAQGSVEAQVTKVHSSDKPSKGKNSSASKKAAKKKKA